MVPTITLDQMRIIRMTTLLEDIKDDPEKLRLLICSQKFFELECELCFRPETQ